MAIPLPAPEAEYDEPTGAPSPPGGVYFDEFTGVVAPEGPVIASWHDALLQDETFTLAGVRFTTLSGNAAVSVRPLASISAGLLTMFAFIREQLAVPKSQRFTILDNLGES